LQKEEKILHAKDFHCDMLGDDYINHFIVSLQLLLEINQ
jgi:hypothetical protein